MNLNHFFKLSAIFPWKPHRKNRPFSGLRGKIDAALVGFDDSLDHTKPQTHSTGFGGELGFENLVLVVVLDTDAIIGDADFDKIAVGGHGNENPGRRPPRVRPGWHF